MAQTEMIVRLLVIEFLFSQCTVLYNEQAHYCMLYMLYRVWCSGVSVSYPGTVMSCHVSYEAHIIAEQFNFTIQQEYHSNFGPPEADDLKAEQWWRRSRYAHTSVRTHRSVMQKTEWPKQNRGALVQHAFGRL